MGEARGVVTRNRLHGSAHTWVAGAIALVAAFGIASTYRTFRSTYDETIHITAGVELLTRRSYTYSVDHPPVARIREAAAE